MKLMLSTLVLLAASSTAGAVDAPVAQPSIALKVAPAEKAGEYRVDIAVTDLETKQSLASPMLLVKSGEQGSVRVARPNEMTVVISVTVDGLQQRVSYSTQVLDHGRVISNASAEIALNWANDATQLRPPTTLR